MATPTPQRRIDALDVPVEKVVWDLAQRAREGRVLGRIAEQRHQCNDDDCDRKFAALAEAHPEACSTPADYPDWTPGGAA